MVSRQTADDERLALINTKGSARRLTREAAWTGVTSAVELLPVRRQRLSWMWTSDVDCRQKGLGLQRQSAGRRASKLCRRRCNVSAQGFARTVILYFPSNMCRCNTFYFFGTCGRVFTSKILGSFQALILSLFLAFASRNAAKPIERKSSEPLSI